MYVCVCVCGGANISVFQFLNCVHAYHSVRHVCKYASVLVYCAYTMATSFYLLHLPPFLFFFCFYFFSLYIFFSLISNTIAFINISVCCCSYFSFYTFTFLFSCNFAFSLFSSICPVGSAQVKVWQKFATLC